MLISSRPLGLHCIRTAVKLSLTLFAMSNSATAVCQQWRRSLCIATAALILSLAWWSGAAAAVEPPLRELFTVDLCTYFQSNVSVLSSGVIRITSNDSTCSQRRQDNSSIAVYRVHVSSDHNNTVSPLTITVRQTSNGEETSWSIPYEVEGFEDVYFQESGQVICPFVKDQNVQDLTYLMYIDALTTSPTSVAYKVMVEPILNFTLNPRVPSENSVTGWVVRQDSQVYYVEVPFDVKRLQVSATGDDDACTIISLQQPTCPLKKLASNVKFTSGHDEVYQTFTTSATLTIARSGIGSQFAIVIVRVPDSECGTNTSVYTHMEKWYEIKVSQPPVADKTIVGVAMALLVVYGLGAGGLVLLCSPWFGCPRIRCKVGDTAGGEETANNAKRMNCLGRILKLEYPKVKTFLPEAYIQNVSGLGLDRVYCWNVFTVLIFYSLPAIQVLLAVLETINSSNDQDRCYYNFKCTHPWTVFGFTVIAMNNIWSNSLYVVYGLFFMIIVWLRKYKYETTKDTSERTQFHIPWLCDKLRRSNCKWKCWNDNGGYSSIPTGNQNDDTATASTQNDGTATASNQNGGTTAASNQREQISEQDDSAQTEYGTPQYTGVFYAMGGALVAEGFMSSIYHICPTERNFQFDTAFMFVLGGMILVKVIQYRQPYINKHAHLAFFSIGVAILLTLIGIFHEGDDHPRLTRAILFLIMFIALMIFFASLYNHQEHSWDVNTCTYTCSCYRDWYRAVKLTVAVIPFVGVAIWSIIAKVGFATTVLYFFIGTAAAFLVSYIASKVYHKECGVIHPLNLFLGAAALAFTIPALRFFDAKVYDTEATPAISRTLNKECIWGDYYDNHDVWHLLGAAGLFSAFLFLLVLDDGECNKNAKDIHIF